MAQAATRSKTAARTSQAKHNPRIASPRSVLGTEAIQLPDDQAVNLAQTIEGDMQTIRANGGNVEKVLSDEAFMNDLLLITVNPAGENENPIAQVVVNNRQFDIPRGRMVRVRRYVVEALAHAKQANFRTKRSLPGDPNHMRTIEQHVWSYPFGVQQDPRGVEGFKWLEKVLADPN